MGFNDVNDYLSSRGLTSTKFDNVGDTKTGILKDVDLQVQTDDNNEVRYQKDGVTPSKQLVITWLTPERDTAIEGDVGMRKLYTSWRMEREIRQAFREAGAPGLEPEAKLTVTYTGEILVQGPKGKVKAKEYTAAYERPAFSAQPRADEATGEVVAEQNAGYSTEAIALATSMWNSGVKDDAIIAQATGIPVSFLKDNVLPF